MTSCASPLILSADVVPRSQADDEEDRKEAAKAAREGKGITVKKERKAIEQAELAGGRKARRRSAGTKLKIMISALRTYPDPPPPLPLLWAVVCPVRLGVCVA